MELTMYCKNLAGERYHLEEAVEDGEVLFFNYCIELCAERLQVEGFSSKDWKLTEVLYEDEGETVFLFQNQRTGSKLYMKVVHEEGAFAVACDEQYWPVNLLGAGIRQERRNERK